MLRFEESFFRRERKDGFDISSTMKRAWAAQLEVLAVIIELCKKNDIKYFAFWGTLLGAIRHRGFIPWDDDIDICMMRKDYMKFLEISKTELPNEFTVLNIYNEDLYENTFTRVTNGREINLTEEHMTKYHGCPFVVGVDIFPLDYISQYEERNLYQKELFKIVKDMMSLSKYVEKNESDLAMIEIVEESKKSLWYGITSIENKINRFTDPSRPYSNRVRQLFDFVCMMYDESEADYVTSMPEYYDDPAFKFSKEFFDDDEMMFENLPIKIPRDYDSVLTVLFGNYMIPVRNTADHDYPFYKEQLDVLKSRGIYLDDEV